MFLSLKGAYGRVYENLEQAVLDWEKGLEFATNDSLAIVLAASTFYNSVEHTEVLIFAGYPILQFCGRTGKLLGLYSLTQRRLIDGRGVSDELRQWGTDTIKLF
jgi:hypothetical protein